jgi:multicomponent Na+:H+ antiporter subunit E
MLVAILWVLATGKLSLSVVILGAAAGTLVLRLTGEARGRDDWFRQARRGLVFALFYLYDALKSAVRIAWEVVTPSLRMRPGVIRVPLEVDSDAEIVAIANLVSLSPGTLTVDVSAHEKVLYVHVMYLGPIDEERERIRTTIEGRVVRMLEPRDGGEA